MDNIFNEMIKVSRDIYPGMENEKGKDFIVKYNTELHSKDFLVTFVDRLMNFRTMHMLTTTLDGFALTSLPKEEEYAYALKKIDLAFFRVNIFYFFLNDIINNNNKHYIMDTYPVLLHTLCHDVIPAALSISDMFSNNTVKHVDIKKYLYKLESIKCVIDTIWPEFQGWVETYGSRKKENMAALERSAIFKMKANFWQFSRDVCLFKWKYLDVHNKIHKEYNPGLLLEAQRELELLVSERNNNVNFLLKIDEEKATDEINFILTNEKIINERLKKQKSTEECEQIKIYQLFCKNEEKLKNAFSNLKNTEWGISDNGKRFTTVFSKFLELENDLKNKNNLNAVNFEKWLECLCSVELNAKKQQTGVVWVDIARVIDTLWINDFKEKELTFLNKIVYAKHWDLHNELILLQSTFLSMPRALNVVKPNVEIKNGVDTIVQQLSAISLKLKPGTEKQEVVDTFLNQYQKFFYHKDYLKAIALALVKHIDNLENRAQEAIKKQNDQFEKSRMQMVYAMQRVNILHFFLTKLINDKNTSLMEDSGLLLWHRICYNSVNLANSISLLLINNNIPYSKCQYYIDQLETLDNVMMTFFESYKFVFQNWSDKWNSTVTNDEMLDVLQNKFFDLYALFVLYKCRYAQVHKIMGSQSVYSKMAAAEEIYKYFTSMHPQFLTVCKVGLEAISRMVNVLKQEKEKMLSWKDGQKTNLCMILNTIKSYEVEYTENIQKHILRETLKHTLQSSKIKRNKAYNDLMMVWDPSSDKEGLLALESSSQALSLIGNTLRISKKSEDFIESSLELIVVYIQSCYEHKAKVDVSLITKIWDIWIHRFEGDDLSLVQKCILEKCHNMKKQCHEIYGDTIAPEISNIAEPSNIIIKEKKEKLPDSNQQSQKNIINPVLKEKIKSPIVHDKPKVVKNKKEVKQEIKNNNKEKEQKKKIEPKPTAVVVTKPVLLSQPKQKNEIVNNNSKLNKKNRSNQNKNKNKKPEISVKNEMNDVPEVYVSQTYDLEDFVEEKYKEKKCSTNKNVIPLSIQEVKEIKQDVKKEVKQEIKYSHQIIDIMPEVKKVLEVLTEAGGPAFLAGGYIRDVLLQKKPHDADIIAYCSKEKIAIALQQLGLNFSSKGKEGDLFVVYGKEIKIDILYSTCSLEEEAWSRDLTINALFCGPDGRVIDPLGVIEDIQNTELQIIGKRIENSFTEDSIGDKLKEDPKRILRLMRFHVELGKSIPLSYHISIQQYAPMLINTLWYNILKEQIKKLFLMGHAQDCFLALNAHQLLPCLIPILSNELLSAMPSELRDFINNKLKEIDTAVNIAIDSKPYYTVEHILAILLLPMINENNIESTVVSFIDFIKQYGRPLDDDDMRTSQCRIISTVKYYYGEFLKLSDQQCNAITHQFSNLTITMRHHQQDPQNNNNNITIFKRL